MSYMEAWISVLGDLSNRAIFNTIKTTQSSSLLHHQSIQFSTISQNLLLCQHVNKISIMMGE